MQMLSIKILKFNLFIFDISHKMFNRFCNRFLSYRVIDADPIIATNHNVGISGIIQSYENRIVN